MIFKTVFVALFAHNMQENLNALKKTERADPQDLCVSVRNKIIKKTFLPYKLKKMYYKWVLLLRKISQLLWVRNTFGSYFGGDIKIKNVQDFHGKNRNPS